MNYLDVDTLNNLKQTAEAAQAVRGDDWYSMKGHNWYTPREVMEYMSALTPEVVLTLVRQARPHDHQLLLDCRRAIKKHAPQETDLTLRLKLAMNTSYNGGGGVHCGAHVDYDPPSRVVATNGFWDRKPATPNRAEELEAIVRGYRFGIPREESGGWLDRVDAALAASVVAGGAE